MKKIKLDKYEQSIETVLKRGEFITKRIRPGMFCGIFCPNGTGLDIIS